MLAPSPVAFEHSHDIVEADSPMFELLPGYLPGIRAPTVFDNKGLHLSMPLMPTVSKTDGELFAVWPVAEPVKRRKTDLSSN